MSVRGAAARLCCDRRQKAELMLPDSTSLLMAIAALCAVLALIWVSARVARAAGLVRPTRAGVHSVAVLETVALDPRRRLHLVGCAGRQVLLLTGGGADLVVGWLGDAAPDAERAP
jgi:flagellar protein FliO/FliZ